MATDTRRAQSSMMLAVIAVLLVIILFVSVYAVLAISALDDQVNYLTGETGAQGSQISSLLQDIVSLQSQVNKLAHPSPTGLSFVLQYACVSVTPDCAGGSVYLVQIANNGSKTYPRYTPVFIGFQENSSSSQVGVNTSLPSALGPGQNRQFSAPAWPQYSDFGSKVSPGDVVKVTVAIGEEQDSVAAMVLTCSTTTTTFQNGTAVQTTTVRNCS